jgi:hypothetical protein
LGIAADADPQLFCFSQLKERFRKRQDTKEKKMTTPRATTSNETDLPTYEVSDEVLETAGSNETVAAFTLGSCTGLSECPG